MVSVLGVSRCCSGDDPDDDSANNDSRQLGGIPRRQSSFIISNLVRCQHLALFSMATDHEPKAPCGHIGTVICLALSGTAKQAPASHQSFHNHNEPNSEVPKPHQPASKASISSAEGEVVGSKTGAMVGTRKW